MAFSDKQTHALRAKLSHKHVRTRSTPGGQLLSYIEGWHAIAEANRIFGHEGWDRQTQSPQCLWSDLRKGETACLYSTKVRISVRAGESVAIREGIGTGFGQSASAEAAHEIAVKAAETDATKRALATFGNPFGLALYHKGGVQVTKPPHQAASLRLVLRHGGREDRFGAPEAFVEALGHAIAGLASIEAVYAFWEANLAALCTISGRRLADGSEASAKIVTSLQHRIRSIAQLSRACDGGAVMTAARAVAPAPGPAPQLGSARQLGSAASSGTPAPAEPKLAIPKDRRVRDKDHLAFVASQPCLVCGRKPSHAHHLRFAQPQAMSLKVSDEFTVPLCNIHHDQLHRAGDERAWWARNGIVDPLKFAHRLWHAPSKLTQSSGADDAAPSGTDAPARANGAAPKQ